jgi:predicted transposase YbfD/YdcC
VAGEVVAIDGKTLCGSVDTAANQHPLHLVSAWATEARLVLGQVAVAAKSNEITAIPLLLELLDLRGGIVTIGALGCQKEIAGAIRAQAADHVLTVKDNQPTLHQEVHEAFLAHAEPDFTDPSLRRLKTVERGHGREEAREYFIAPAPPATSRATCQAVWAPSPAWRTMRSSWTLARRTAHARSLRPAALASVTSPGVTISPLPATRASATPPATGSSGSTPTSGSTTPTGPGWPP